MSPPRKRNSNKQTKKRTNCKRTKKHTGASKLDDMIAEVYGKKEKKKKVN